MDIRLLDQLRDPVYGTGLKLEEGEDIHLEGTELIKGTLLNEENCIRFEVVDGIPLLIVKDKKWGIKRDGIETEFAHGYNDFTVETNLLRDKFYNWRMKNAIDSFCPRRSDKVLNVGCYNCLETLILKNYTPFVISTDIDFNILRILYRFSKKSCKLDFNLVCCDCERLPFPDEFFDYVMLRQTLHHMPNLWRAIEELFRVTKTGGKVVILSEPVYPIAELNGLLYSSSNYYPNLWAVLRKLKHWVLGNRMPSALSKKPKQSDRFLYLPYILFLLHFYSNRVAVQIPQGNLSLNVNGKEIDIDWNGMEVDASSWFRKIMPKAAWYKGEIDFLITKTRNRKLKKNGGSVAPVGCSELSYMSQEDEVKAYKYLEKMFDRIETGELCV